MSREAFMTKNLQGVWVGADGSTRPARIKGGPLFDAFHGIRRREERDLNASRPDLARAYASAVWAYRCIKLRADSVAGVPLVLLDRSGEPVADHPILNLLQDVNPYTMNLGDLLRATEAAYNIWGTAYWLKTLSTKVGLGPVLTNGSGGACGIKWLTWLNPQTVEPVVDGQRGITGYKQTVNGQTRTFSPEEVIAFRNFDPLDDLGGLSPLSVALNEVNAELNASRFVSAFFANDARPAGLLSTDTPIVESEMERIRGWWNRLFQGAANKWKTGIVGGGLRWQTITFPPTDLALKELREEDRRAICAVFGVPSALAGAWEAATYATAREQKASFYEDTIIPQLEYIAEVLNWSLLPHYPDLTARDARLAWDLDSIAALRESATDKAERLTHLFQSGVITRNEVRAGLGMVLLPETDDGFVFELQNPKPNEEETDRPILPADQNDAENPISVGTLTQDSTPVRTNGSKALPGDEAILAELRRWKRFAVRRMKAGQSLRDFETSVIPVEIWDEINDMLDDAQTVDEVRALFDMQVDAVGEMWD
jgi:HK97 family phage portal protein